jgi:cobalt-zinc-cadmium efflux system membrane fusion protein
MSISMKQRIATAAIVAIGLVAGAGVLMTERRTSGEAAEAVQAQPEHDTHEAKEAHEIALDDAQIRQAGIDIQPAGPGSIQAASPFQGEVRFNEDRTAHVVPRLAGVAEAVPANLGQTVQQGQLLAVIASPVLSELRSELLTAQQRRDAAGTIFEREKTLWDDRISAQQDFQQAQTALQEADIALQNARQKLAAVGASARSGPLNRFEIRAPFEGTIVEKHLALGEAVGEAASIFTVSDLRTVWVEFAVAPKDLGAVRVGQTVIVSSSAFDSQVQGTVSYVGALLGEQTRTARARVTVQNPQGVWRPGLFVTVSVLGDSQPVAVAVPAEAIQTIDNRPVVFKPVPGGFAAVPVQLGRSDSQRVELVQGLQAGDRVAVSNTFLLKAELGKAGAEAHGH